MFLRSAQLLIQKRHLLLSKEQGRCCQAGAISDKPQRIAYMDEGAPSKVPK